MALPGIGSLELYQIVLLAVLATVLGIGLVTWSYIRRQRKAVEDELEDTVADARATEADKDLPEEVEEDDPGHSVEITRPAPAGGFVDLIRTWRHRAKERKLAKKGYIKWYKIDSRFPRPVWVKPKMRESGELEYYDKTDKTLYAFPQDKLVYDEASGAVVAVHTRGDYDPLNIRDPMMPSINGRRMEELVQLNAESEAPSALNRFLNNLSPQMLVAASIAFLIVIGAAAEVMG